MRRSGMMINLGPRTQMTDADMAVLSRPRSDTDESVIPRDVLSAELEEELRQSRSRSRSPRQEPPTATRLASFPLPRAPQVRRVTFDDEAGVVVAGRQGTRRSEALVPRYVQDPALTKILVPSGGYTAMSPAQDLPQQYMQEPPRSILRPSVVPEPSNVHERWAQFSSGKLHDYDALRLQPPPRSRSSSPTRSPQSDSSIRLRSSSAGSATSYRAHAAAAIDAAPQPSFAEQVDAYVQRVASYIDLLRSEPYSTIDYVNIYEKLRQLEYDFACYRHNAGFRGHPLVGTPEFVFYDAMLSAVTSVMDCISSRFRPQSAADQHRRDVLLGELTEYRASLLPSAVGHTQRSGARFEATILDAARRTSFSEVSEPLDNDSRHPVPESRMPTVTSGTERPTVSVQSSAGGPLTAMLLRDSTAAVHTDDSQRSHNNRIVPRRHQSYREASLSVVDDANVHPSPPESSPSAAAQPSVTRDPLVLQGPAPESHPAPESTDSRPPSQHPAAGVAPVARAEAPARRPEKQAPPPRQPQTAPPPPPAAQPLVTAQHSYAFFAGMQSREQQNYWSGDQDVEEVVEQTLPRSGRDAALMRRKDKEIMCLRAALLKAHNRLAGSPLSRSGSAARGGSDASVIQSAMRQAAPPHVAGIPFRSIPLYVPASISQQHGNLMMLSLEEKTFTGRDWKPRYIFADDRGVYIYKDSEDYKKHSYQKVKVTLLYRQCDFFVPHFSSSASLTPQAGSSLYHQYATDAKANYLGFVVKQPVGSDSSTPTNPVLLFKTESCQEHADWAHFLCRHFNLKLYREMFPTLFVSEENPSGVSPRRIPSPERAEATTQTFAPHQAPHEAETPSRGGNPTNESTMSSQPPPPDFSPPAGALNEQRLHEADESVSPPSATDAPIGALEGVHWSTRRCVSFAMNTSPVPTASVEAQCEEPPKPRTDMVSKAVGPDVASLISYSKAQAEAQPSSAATAVPVSCQGQLSADSVQEQQPPAPQVSAQTQTLSSGFATAAPAEERAQGIALIQSSHQLEQIMELQQEKATLESNLASLEEQSAALKEGLDVSQEEVRTLRRSLQELHAQLLIRQAPTLREASADPIVVQPNMQTTEQAATCSQEPHVSVQSIPAEEALSSECENCAHTLLMLQDVAGERDALVRELNRQQEEYSRGVSAMCAKVLDDMDVIRGTYQSELMSGPSPVDMPLLVVHCGRTPAAASTESDFFTQQRSMSGDSSLRASSDAAIDLHNLASTSFDIQCAADPNAMSLIESHGDYKRNGEMRVVSRSMLPSRRGWSFRDNTSGATIQIDVQVVPGKATGSRMSKGKSTASPARLVLRGPQVTPSWHPTQRRPVVPHTGI